MIEELKKYKDKSSIVLLPKDNFDIYDSINYTLKNVIKIDSPNEDNCIIEMINDSKINKIYFVGYNDIYRYIMPRIKNDIEVCWIYPYSFSNLSNAGVRYNIQTIFEYYDRNLIESIGCFSTDNKEVFENAGYKTEFIDLKIEKELNITVNKSNSIGILSDDFDPNNNFYNQLAALTFINYDICKITYIMRATKEFIKFFDLKCKKESTKEDVMKDNFVNLYINFTNTNNELIQKSFNLGIPCIVGNTSFFDNNSYLKEHLVVKSDDDINEIAEKIEFVRKNAKKILEEYKKI